MNELEIYLQATMEDQEFCGGTCLAIGDPSDWDCDDDEFIMHPTRKDEVVGRVCWDMVCELTSSFVVECLDASKSNENPLVEIVNCIFWGDLSHRPVVVSLAGVNNVDTYFQVTMDAWNHSGARPSAMKESSEISEMMSDWQWSKPLMHPSRKDDLIGGENTREYGLVFTPDFIKECFATVGRPESVHRNPLLDYLYSLYPIM